MSRRRKKKKRRMFTPFNSTVAPEYDRLASSSPVATKTPPKTSLFRAASTITWHPAAWLKYKYFCHKADNEISGMAVSSANNPLYVEDFYLIKQEASYAHISLDMAAMSDHM